MKFIIDNIRKITFIMAFLLVSLHLNSLFSVVELDARFGADHNGIVSINYGVHNYLSSLVIQPADQKIVVGGGIEDNFTAIRYNTNGSIDTSFGKNGISNSALGTSGDRVFATALQADGKILLAGNNDKYFATVRLLSNGVADPSFGVSGVVTTSVGDGGCAKAIAVQSDGKIVVAGSVIVSGVIYSVLVRYDANGNLDTSFNGTGIVLATYGNGCRMQGMTIQEDQKIIVVGASNQSFFLMRYNTNGSLDTTFGSAGLLYTQVGPSSQGFAVTTQADGKIIAGGAGVVSGSSGFTSGFALIRYNTDGTLDTSFGTNGVARTYISPFAVVRGLTIDADGKIIAVGFTRDDNNKFKFAIARYNTNGTLDTTFSEDGVATVDAGSYGGLGGVVSATDGRIFGAGLMTLSSKLIQGALLCFRNKEPFLDLSIDATGHKVAFSGGASEANAQVNLILNNSLLLTVTTNDNGYWSSNQTFLLESGSNTIEADLIVNNSILITTTSEFTITSSDSISILNPINNASLSDSEVHIFGDSSRALAQVEIVIDNIVTTTVNTDISGEWDAGNVSVLNGTHSIAANLWNNNSKLTSDTITITSLAPYGITISSPEIDLTTNQNTVSINGTSNSYDNRAQVFLDGTYITTIRTDEFGNWDAGTASNLSLGLHYIRAQLCNDQGQVLASATNNFKISS